MVVVLSSIAIKHLFTQNDKQVDTVVSDSHTSFNHEDSRKEEVSSQLPGFEEGFEEGIEERQQRSGERQISFLCIPASSSS